MAKSASGKYQGSLSLEWFNKQKAILLLGDEDAKKEGDIPAPRINWINRDDALFYEIDEEEGKGLSPYWVDRNDIRVKEARPLVFKKSYIAESKDKKGSLPGTDVEYKVKESKVDDPAIQNWLIKGDNLLALNALKRHFDKLPDEQKVKCVYIDPPFNTSNAFDYYDDNYAHSEWLSLMRDRLVVLHSLLATDGYIFVHIDDNELGYLTLLLDEVFGRDNRISLITFKQSSVSGPKAVNPGLVTISSYILYYVKDRAVWAPNKIYVPTNRADRYNKYIINFHDEYKDWKLAGLLDVFAEHTGVEKSKLKEHFGPQLEESLEQFVLEQRDRVVRTARVQPNDVNEDAREALMLSESHRNTVFRAERADKEDYYFLNGEQLLFYRNKTAVLDGVLTTVEAASNIWQDLLSNNLHNEGGVSFKDGKKPEALIRRLLEISTNEGDLVLDCFGGSGTTFAVSHKLNRRWIGIEIGNHADSHIIPRMTSTLSGEDKSGVSKAVQWQGGGSFKYYHLGPSIIHVDKKTGKGEFNWKLGREFLQESLLQSYDFVPDATIKFSQDLAGDRPAIGRLESPKGVIFGVAWLVAPDEPAVSIDAKTVQALYNTLKEHKPQSIHVFTNKGWDIKQDAMPADMEIVKVPHAIFAELER